MDGRERTSIKEEIGEKVCTDRQRERLGLVALESFQILSLSVFLQQCEAKHICWDYFSLDRWIVGSKKTPLYIILPTLHKLADFRLVWGRDVQG